MSGYLVHLKNWMWQKKMQKILLRDRVRKRCFTHLDKGQSVGIYLSYPSEEQRVEIDRFMQNLYIRGIEVCLLIYIPKDKADVKGDGKKTFILHEKELGFSHIPRSEAQARIKPFLESPFDLYFDASQEFHYTDAYITARSHARFKVGKAGSKQEGLYDLELSSAQALPYGEYLNLLTQYLENF